MNQFSREDLAGRQRLNLGPVHLGQAFLPWQRRFEFAQVPIALRESDRYGRGQRQILDFECARSFASRGKTVRVFFLQGAAKPTASLRDDIDVAAFAVPPSARENGSSAKRKQVRDTPPQRSARWSRIGCTRRQSVAAGSGNVSFSMSSHSVPERIRYVANQFK